MIVAAMKGGATEFKIGSQVAGELANIEQLSGKLKDLNAGKLPGEMELSKYYDKTPLGQAISEANKTGFGGANGFGKDYVDILSPETRQHILYGDKPGSGGHMWPGQEGKTVFPESWSGDKIIDVVGDITTSPSTKWYAQTGTGGTYTAKGDAAKWVAYETRNGVRVRVVYQPATGKVVTAFPDDAPIPPYKPIK